MADLSENPPGILGEILHWLLWTLEEGTPRILGGSLLQGYSARTFVNGHSIYGNLRSGHSRDTAGFSAGFLGAGTPVILGGLTSSWDARRDSLQASRVLSGYSSELFGGDTRRNSLQASLG